MGIGIITKNTSEYDDLVSAFFNTSLVGTNKLEEFANDCLQPFRLWLTGCQSKKVTFLLRGYVVNEEIENRLTIVTNEWPIYGFFFGVACMAASPITSITIGIANGLIEGPVAGMRTGLDAAIYAIAISIFITLTSTLVLPIIILTMATVAGLIFKGFCWASKPDIVDKYRQYLQQERTICEEATTTLYQHNNWEEISVDEGKPADTQVSVNFTVNTDQTPIYKLSYHLFKLIIQNLSHKDIDSLRLVSHRFLHWLPQQRNWRQIRQKALLELKRIFGDQLIEDIGVESLMAYPPLQIPYHIFEREFQDVTLLQRCGSTDLSQSITLTPYELGGKKVRWGLKPVSFIAILKEGDSEDSFARLAQANGSIDPTPIAKQHVEVIYSDRMMNIY